MSFELLIVTLYFCKGTSKKFEHTLFLKYSLCNFKRHIHNSEGEANWKFRPLPSPKIDKRERKKKKKNLMLL